jgi:hypothetical protein
MSRGEGVRIHIGKLPEGTTKGDLDAHFGDMREDVKDMWVARNPAGFAFIRVPEDRVEAFIAKYNGSTFKDAQIAVERARGEPRRGGAGGVDRRRDRDDRRDRREDSRDRRRRSDSRDRRRRSDSRDHRRRRSDSREDRRRRSDSR